MDLTGRLQASLRDLGVGDTDPIGIACSGGADSVALTHLAARAGRAITVLHVDHGLRDDSSDDARFVSALASDLGVPCRVATVAIDRTRRGLEADARAARYEALQRAAGVCGLDRVATAHTRDDQAETVLLRTIRGGALSAIAPVRGIFVRPLLDVTRDDLRVWLMANSLSWREDPTNADERVERNWLRRTIIPLLASRRPGVASVLARRAEQTREDANALDQLADAIFARASVDDVGVHLPAHELVELPQALRTRVFRRALHAAGSPARIGDVCAIDALDVGAHVRCSGVTAWRWRRGWAIVRDGVDAPEPLMLPLGATASSGDWGVHVRLGPATAPSWTWRTLVPGDATTVALRARVPGDRVPTVAGTRKVQDVMVDAKIPRPLRAFVPVVATDDRPLAVVGLTTGPERSMLAVDVEPADPSWSRAVVWNA